jgi:hypothetical protein
MSVPLVPVLSQMNAVHTNLSYFFKARLNIISHLLTGLSPSDFTIQMKAVGDISILLNNFVKNFSLQNVGNYMQFISIGNSE